MVNLKIVPKTKFDSKIRVICLPSNFVEFMGFATMSVEFSSENMMYEQIEEITMGRV